MLRYMHIYIACLVYNQNGESLQRGMNWVFKHNRLSFVLKWLRLCRAIMSVYFQNHT
jgi:hypothetical protein